jgi:hypothetical protein
VNSVRKSVRLLRDFALSCSSDKPPGEITRTLKLKVDIESSPELGRNLNRLFNAFEEFRKNVLDELEERWNDDPEAFTKMVKATTSKPYKEKTTCFGWLSTRFLTGAELNENLPRKAAFALLYSLSGGLKSFLTRRTNVSKDIQAVIKDNVKTYKQLKVVATDQEETDSLPSPPPEITDKELTKEAIQTYNDWVGLLRSWVNLVLKQRHGLGRDDAPMPRYLKGYPGFPGSQRYLDSASLSGSLAKLEKIVDDRESEVNAIYADLADEEWETIKERFTWEVREDEDGNLLKPRSARETTCARFAWLLQNKPDFTPAQIVAEVISGIKRSLAKTRRHLESCSYSDRQSVNQFQSLCNVATVLALEPLRIRGLYEEYYLKDTPRRNAFGDSRGAMHQPSDDSAAVPISGFSLSSDSPQYGGMLANRKTSESTEKWSFLYALEGQNMKLLPAGTVTAPKGYASSDLRGFAKEGRRDEARLVRGNVWLPEDADKRPIELPLRFGTRQGREYFWHFERGLVSKDDWLIGGDARILRIMPPGNTQQAAFFVTITFTRQVPPPVEHQSDFLIGIDRGEKIPAAYAITDAKGKLVDSGAICEEYLAQQEAFNRAKRELQRSKGGYSRALRAKERNRAKALGGDVTRHLVHLAAVHKAPLVLENLTSGIVTRGGKGIIMSRMQYERILVGVEQKFAEAGLYDLPNGPQFRKRDNGFIKLVGPAYTSSTCSACGQVHSNDFYESLVPSLEKNGELWQVTLPDGSVRPMPERYEYYLRGFGLKERNVDERIREILGTKTPDELSQTARKRLVSHLRNYWLAYRPTQAEFRCVSCRHEMNADLQGGLNIARKHLFNMETDTKSKEDTEKGRRNIMQEWERWYKTKVANDWP